MSAHAPTRFGHVQPPKPGWLGVPEPAFDPRQAIVDTHHHVWDRPGHRYLFPDFLEDLHTGHNVVATVFMECHAMYRAYGPDKKKPVGEVEFAAGIAAMSESGNYGPTRVHAGIVGFADLMLGDRVVPVLEALVDAGGGRLRGVRYAGAWDADPAIGTRSDVGPQRYLSAQLQAGVRRLASMGLSFDAWVFHPQLADVAALARACPDANIVLGHMGGPLGYGPYAGKRDEVFAQWKSAMTELAACDNVCVKLGGVMMRLAAFDYGRAQGPVTSTELARLWSPWVMTCLELFGPGRCMVESNFPVEKMGIGYAGLWNTLQRILAGLSPSEKQDIFSGTADRFYRLGLGVQAREAGEAASAISHHPRSSPCVVAS